MTRPHVSLCYAQSLDGCIAARPGEPTRLSGALSMAYTHGLRATHDAILVGVGTVIADNPRLTVRLAAGENPQPVVLDTSLRIPDSCALVASPARPLWVLCAEDAPAARQQQLRALGVRVIPLPLRGALDTRWQTQLDALGGLGVRRVMVEGGAQVIRSLLVAGLADWVSVTIAPLWLAGLSALSEGMVLPTLRNAKMRLLEPDVVLEADLHD
jgi:GTP cyclohydrolase II